MLLLLLALDAEERKLKLQAAAELLGGNAQLGRALGYRDGAFVGQMLRGQRPITEKTLAQMAKVPTLSPLFSTNQAGSPAVLDPVEAVTPSAPPSVGASVERLGQLLQAATPQTRGAVAGLLAQYAQDPAQGSHIAQAIELLLGEGSADDPNPR